MYGGRGAQRLSVVASCRPSGWARKSAGKLLTELGPLLSADERETSVVQITRDRSYSYAVDIQRQNEVDPEVAQAAQRFAQRMADETVDLTSSILQVPANEMATHEKIAKRLQLTGQT